jgi:hypothetical protein
MTAALMLLAGTGLLAIAGLAWSGRWRAWARRFLIGPTMPVTLVPGLGIGLVGGGLSEATGSDTAGALGLLGLVVGAVLCFWSPQWFGPRWLREARRAGIAPDLSDPLTALSVAALAPGAAQSPPHVAEHFHGSPQESWNATWVQHEDGGPAPHALARAGAVQGKLELYPDGVAFRAIGLEDRLRGSPTVLIVPREDLLDARVVPAGAGPDGVRRPRHGPRSAFARLVLDTRAGAQLFEVNFAKRKAARIRALLGSGPGARGRAPGRSPGP